MEVCNKCGRIIEEDHVCSKALMGNDDKIANILKVEPQLELLSRMEKLELNKGDLLLFSYDPQMEIDSIQETGQQIVAMIEEYKDTMVPVIFLPNNFCLQSMTKQDLGEFLNDAQKIYEDMDDEEKTEIH